MEAPRDPGLVACIVAIVLLSLGSYGFWRIVEAVIRSWF